MNLQFLGTGGGRFATIGQKRMTGGFRIDGFSGKNIHVDPGPGALVRCHQFGINPRKTHMILVSHSHTDHYTDAEVLIEAMTQGMRKKTGYVVGSESVINGYEEWGPAISNYHQSKPTVHAMKAGDIVKEKGVVLKATRTKHGDPSCVGFNISQKNFTISYTADTEYFPELYEDHEGTDILIGCVIKAGKRKIKGHMRTNDFRRLVEEVQPKLAIMTHMGINLIMNNPFQDTRKISEETGVRTIAATDGLKMDLRPYLQKD